MIGIFDSGVGGLTALKEVRRLLPKVDITYLADRKNAPYGTKDADEILSLAQKNISLLRDAGASRILIACCTASTLYPRLSAADKEISIPIILPAAEAAARTTASGRIAVIATHATVRSRAFSRAISSLGGFKVAEFDAQPLVAMVEAGARDGTALNVGELCELERILIPIRSFDADTLILGCTHFPHLKEHIGGLLPGIALINPSLEGALKVVNPTPADESGRTVYL